MNEIKPKKVLSKNVAIALGIMLIILVASLGATVVYTINHASNHHHTDDQYNSLQSQLSNLTSIVNFANGTDWLFNQTTVEADSYVSWNFTASYAGYIVISLLTGNFPESIQVTYTSYAGFYLRGTPFTYDQRIDGLSDGYFHHTFPVLPASVQIKVYNTGSDSQKNATWIEITYFY